MARTFLSYALALGVMAYLSYGLPLWLPGDFATAMYASSDVVLSPQEEARLTPVPPSFLAYVGAFMRGDFGLSLAYGVPISTLLGEALPWTLLLGLCAYLSSFAVAFVLGVESAFRRASKVDRRLSGAMVSLDGVPELVLGVVFLLFFGAHLGWFPLQGALTPYSDKSGIAHVADVLAHLCLPAMTLFLASLSGQFLLVRVSVLHVLPAPFVSCAHLRGIGPWRVRYKYVALNALLPIVVRFGFRLASMVTSLIVVETIFAYPGIGSLLMDAVAKRDVPVIQVVVTLLSLGVVGMSVLLEGVAFWLKPKGNRA